MSGLCAFSQQKLNLQLETGRQKKIDTTSSMFADLVVRSADMLMATDNYSRFREEVRCRKD